VEQPGDHRRSLLRPDRALEQFTEDDLRLLTCSQPGRRQIQNAWTTTNGGTGSADGRSSTWRPRSGTCPSGPRLEGSTSPG
jgi:hypothetical protein